MADENIIKNVGGQDGVASEATMQKLLAAMEKMAKASGKDPNSQEKRLRDAMGKSLMGNITAIKSTSVGLGGLAKSIIPVASAMSVLSKASYGAGAVLGAAAKSLSGFGKEILIGGERLQDFSQHIPLVNSQLTVLARELDNATDSYRQLTAVGASFNNSILDMYKASISAAMGFERFSQFIIDNSDRMNFFAGTVSSGAREIGKLSKQMREGDLSNALFNMGYTIEDISEGLINYTQLQARTTGRRIRDENTLIQGTRSYLEEINKLAKITGLNRKEQEQIMLQNMQEANIAVIRSRLTGEARDNFDSSLKLMAANFPEYTAAFKDLMDGIPQTELGAKLASLVPGFSDLAEAAARGEITQEEFDKRIRGLAPRFEELREQFGPAGITALMQNGFSEFFDGMFRISEYTSKVFDPVAAEEEARQRDAITTALTQFSNVVNQIRSGLFNAFFESGFFKNMETFVDKTFTSEKIDKFSKDIANFMNAFIEDPSAAIADFFDGLGTMFSNIWNSPAGQRVANAITDMFNFLVEEIILSIADNTPFMGGAAEEIQRRRITEKTASGVDLSPEEKSFMQEDITNRIGELEKRISIIKSLSRTGLFSRGLTESEQTEIGALEARISLLTRELENLQGFSMGTRGFQDFGKGTLAILHGREAVVPEDSELGQLIHLASADGPRRPTFSDAVRRPPATPANPTPPVTSAPSAANPLGVRNPTNGGPFSRAWQAYQSAIAAGTEPPPRELTNRATNGPFTRAMQAMQAEAAAAEAAASRPVASAATSTAANAARGAGARGLLGGGLLGAALAAIFAPSSLGDGTIPFEPGPDILSDISNPFLSTGARNSNIRGIGVENFATPRLSPLSAPSMRDVLMDLEEALTDRTPAISEQSLAQTNELVDSIQTMNQNNVQSTNNSMELQKKLNMIMNDIRTILYEMRDVSKKIETNTRSLGTNVSSGKITNIR